MAKKALEIPLAYLFSLSLFCCIFRQILKGFNRITVVNNSHPGGSKVATEMAVQAIRACLFRTYFSYSKPLLISVLILLSVQRYNFRGAWSVVHACNHSTQEAEAGGS
jgi:hypothetical protein